MYENNIMKKAKWKRKWRNIENINNMKEKKEEKLSWQWKK